MRKVVLHLGSHKTGSTSIQISLESSRSNLENLGVFLPPKTPTYLNRDSDQFASVLNLRSLGNYGDLAHLLRRDSYTTMEQNARELLSAELSIVDGATLILSGEDFATLDSEQVECFRNFFLDEEISFHLVYFLRHQSESVVGIYQTGLLHYPQEVLSFESFYEEIKEVLKYDEIIERWDSFFDFTSINLLNYNDLVSGNPVDSIQEFAIVLSQILETQVHLESVEKANRGLGLLSLNLLDALHPYLNGTLREAVISLISAVDSSGEGTIRFLTTGQFNAITDEFKVTNNNLLNRHQFLLTHPDASTVNNLKNCRPSIGDLIEQLEMSKGSLIKSLVRNSPFTVIDENTRFSNPYIGLEVAMVKESVAISLKSSQVIGNSLVPMFPSPQERGIDNSNEESDIYTYIEQIDRIRLVTGNARRVLQLGCKWGYLSRLLFSLGDDVEVHCSDHDISWVNTVHVNSPFAQTFFLNSASELPFRDEFADVVVAGHSFVSYLGYAKLKAYLDEIARVLELGGYLFFDSISMTEEDANSIDLQFDSPMCNWRSSQIFVFNEQYIRRILPSELTLLSFETTSYFDFYVLQKIQA